MSRKNGRSKIKQRARQTRRRGTVGTIVATILVALFVVLMVIYFGVVYYFSKHFYPKSQLNGLEIGGDTSVEAQKRLESETQDYLLTVYDRDGAKYHIKGYDFNYQYRSTGEEETVLGEQNAWAWPVLMRKKVNYDMKVSITYDENKLSQAVSSLDCFKEENITHPQDAYISETADGFNLVEEVRGNELIPDKVQADIKAAVDAGETEIKLTDEDYIAPAVTREDQTLTAAFDKISSYMNSTVTYDIPSYDEKVDSAKIASWISLGPDYSITVDESAVASYVQSLATKYNTYGDVRQFKTTYGDVVEIGGGDYGWIVDKEAEAQQLLADISSGQPVEREPIYAQTAIMRDGTYDIGATYIEVDYTNQHLWYYKDGQCMMDADVVSGNISKGNGSPDGIFKINYKKSPAVLKGEDYISDVDYFMVFAYNVGFHDASWRHGRFGGTLYKTIGSHGCVNIAHESAEKLYGMLEAGTPVVAYYREPVELKAENCRISNAFSYVKETKQTEGE